jgi:hypothetical protein
MTLICSTGQPKGYRTLAKVILSNRALSVLKDLTQSGLPYIQVSVFSSSM